MRILFQGDSITDCGRNREWEFGLGDGYPHLTAAHLGFKEPGKYEFLNRGIGGNRIVDLYARIKSDIINLKPNVMSILIGVNDVWHEFDYNNGVDSEKFFNIYSMLIEEVKAALPDINIMIMEPFTLKGTGNEKYFDAFQADTFEKAAMAKKIAEKYNLPFIPLQEKFDEAAKLAPNNYWLGDGVHPTFAGHELIKNEWLKAFNAL